MKEEIKTCRFIKTFEDVLEYDLSNASVEYAVNPFFTGGGYHYKVDGDIMYIVSESLIDPYDGRIFAISRMN